MTNVKANRRYKDRLFRIIFSEKEDLLSLYNAVNGSCYQDPTELEITTIEDVLYMGMKNDISFLIENFMNLYEHQSSRNPNMPLRGLFYFSRLYSSYIESRQLDIYSSKLLMLPVPRYIVFYNGTKTEPEVQTLRLSSSFERTDTGQELGLECIATVLNINYGQNQKLMEGCAKLREYAYLINQIREALGRGMRLEAAVDRAVQNCLQNGILTDFLTRHREEAKLLILSEYNEELHQKTTYKEGYEDGEAQGIQIGETRGIQIGKAQGIQIGEAQGILIGQNRMNALFQKLIAQQRIDDLKRATEDPEFQKMLLEEFDL